MPVLELSQSGDDSFSKAKTLRDLSEAQVVNTHGMLFVSLHSATNEGIPAKVTPINNKLCE